MAQDRHLRRREGRRQVLVRAGPRQQVLGCAARAATTRRWAPRRRPSHPQGRGRLDRRRSKRSSGSTSTSARARKQCWVNHLTDLRQVDPAPARLRPDAVSTSASAGAIARTSARSRTGSATFSISSSPPRATRRISTSRAISERKAKDSRGAATTRGQDLIADLDQEFGPDAVRRGKVLFARELRALPFEHSGHPGGLVREPGFLRGGGGPSAQGAQGFPRQRRVHAGDRSRHVPLPRAAFQSHGGPPVFRIRLRNAARQGGGCRHSRARGIQGQRPRLLPQHLAAQRVGDGAVHAQQRDRSRDLRQAEERGERFLPRRYVDAYGKLVDPQPHAWLYDPSVDGRFELYKQSMHELLHPEGARHQA